MNPRNENKVTNYPDQLIKSCSINQTKSEKESGHNHQEL